MQMVEYDISALAYLAGDRAGELQLRTMVPANAPLPALGFGRATRMVAPSKMGGFDPDTWRLD